jgi:SOS-response transcriptional repressor LexA
MSSVATRRAEYRVFQALGENCGVLVHDIESGQLVFRFRRDWEDFAGEEADVLSAIAEDLPRKAAELGTEAFLRWIDADLSNTFSVLSPRNALCGRDIEATAQALYRRAVTAVEKPYVTHVPLRTMRAAAGGFGRDMADDEIGEWVEVPPAVRRLTPDHFAVRIEGRSMEPDIPAGSLCLFRRYQGGSRAGKIVLVQRTATSESGGEVTIKRYASAKRETGEDSWQHEEIRMQPENPEYPEWALESEGEDYRTIAEFIQVLEIPID